MLVKDLIERLNNLPDDAEVVISYVYEVDGETVSCTEDIADIEFDSKIVDLMTKGYMENQNGRNQFFEMDQRNKPVE